MLVKFVRYVVLYLYVLSVPLPVFGGPSFNKISELPEDCGHECSIQMVSLESGWLFSPLAIWRTRDGGHTWERRSIPPQITAIDAPQFVFADNSNGWLLAASQHLYSTKDGAITWREQALPTPAGVIDSIWVEDVG